MGKDDVSSCGCQFEETQLSRLLLIWRKDCLRANNSWKQCQDHSSQLRIGRTKASLRAEGKWPLSSKILTILVLTGKEDINALDQQGCRYGIESRRFLGQIHDNAVSFIFCNCFKATKWRTMYFHDGGTILTILNCTLMEFRSHITDLFNEEISHIIC